MEGYLMGLLIILIGVVLVLTYFISKQVRDMKRDLKINIQDLLAVKEKMLKFEHILKIHAQLLQQGGGGPVMDEEPTEFDPSTFEQQQEDTEMPLEDTDPQVFSGEQFTEEEDVINTLDLTEDTDEYDVVGSDEPVDESDKNSGDMDEVMDDDEDEEVMDEDDTVEVEDVTHETEVENTLGDTTVDTADEDTDEATDATADEVASDVVSDDTSSDDSQKNPRKKRVKQPSEKAARFDEGHRMDNMGATFEVYLDSRNRKRWKRLTLSESVSVE